MAKSVIVNIVVADAPLPSGTSFDHLAVVLVDSSGTSQTKRVDGITELSATFDNVEPGAATVTAQAVGTDNLPFGDVATLDFTVEDTPVATFPQPVLLSIG